MTKVLFCTEASFTSSGFAVNAHELLTRFQSTGKYELAEFAAFGGSEFNGETRHLNLPWKYYPNLPQSQEEAAQYVPSRDKWGAWKFDWVVQDFFPDIVLHVFDVWDTVYMHRSPLRHTYKLLTMPPIDSERSDPDYNQLYDDADGFFTCTDWAAGFIKKNKNIKFLDVVYPGLNPAFKPVKNKISHKKNCGIPEDSVVFGSVMRNQPRKLFPNIAETFASLKKVLPKEVWDKCRLYWHTSYPDIAWNIPRLIVENDIGDKVYLTYVCKCGAVNPSLYAGTERPCAECDGMARLASVQGGVSYETMAGIFNLFDCCVQYATNEGFGRQQIEAAACGVPVITVDHSGMKDMIKDGGIPVPVLTTYYDKFAHREFAVPNDTVLLKRMSDFATNPYRDFALAQRIKDKYDWDQTAKKWMDGIDSLTREKK